MLIRFNRIEIIRRIRAHPAEIDYRTSRIESTLHDHVVEQAHGRCEDSSLQGIREITVIDRAD